MLLRHRLIESQIFHNLMPSPYFHLNPSVSFTAIFASCDTSSIFIQHPPLLSKIKNVLRENCGYFSLIS